LQATISVEFAVTTLVETLASTLSTWVARELAAAAANRLKRPI
jgi:hypothetical protein